MKGVDSTDEWMSRWGTMTDKDITPDFLLKAIKQMPIESLLLPDLMVR